MVFDLASFGSAAFVVWRESFEAILLVGILLGLLQKIGGGERRPVVWAGAGVGVAASVAIGYFLMALAGDLRERSEQGFEAGASLLAAVVLTYMIVWMYRHTQEMMGGLQSQVRAALEGGAVGLLFWMPLLAVVREGFETVLFLTADGDAGVTLLAGLAVGLAAAVALGWLLFKGIVHLSVERFFAATGAFLVLFAAWMLYAGIHELGEILETRSEAGEWLAGPVAIAAGAGYLLALGIWYLKPHLTHRLRAPEALRHGHEEPPGSP